MKSLRLLTIAPALLVMSLTACAGAKMDAEKAKEKADGYDAAAVVEKYSAVEVTTKVEIKKSTGVFGEGGILSAATAAIKAQAGTEKLEGEDVAEYVCSAEMVAHFADMGEQESYTITFYSYKSSGMKIEVKNDGATTILGYDATGKGTANTYVLDDGRMEKGDSKQSIKVSGTKAGIAVEGELEYTMSMTAKWTAK